jgi:UDP-glucuronate 4-epimerase
MNVLLTGTAGFIGSHVADALLARGDGVWGVDNFNDYYSPPRKWANVAAARANPRFTLCEVDVRDREAITALFDETPFDVVIHLAAMAGVRYSIERAPLYVDVNVQGTVNLLDGARGTGVPHFVFASTSSVYGRTEQLPFRESDPLGRPLAPYPATKIAAEVMGHAYHNMFDLSFTALRFFSVYGPRGRPDMMPYHVTDCIARDNEFMLFEAGEMFRDWTYVADIVAGILAAADRPQGYAVFNLGRGEPVRMADFVEIIEALVGRGACMTTPPAPPSEPPITYADITKAEERLDYHPTVPIEEGLEHLWAWYREEIL